ncbi:methyltransferase domain-containing protein [uncultured Jannaschia sp.]|uniref:methyltransferase domain-containing protein n=1 Tax=uncultured Jannaschia sp. TaxID=293347 RepID=UPI00343E5459
MWMAGIRTGQHVPDVAEGAGDQTRDLAQRVGPSGAVGATDPSPAILDLARRYPPLAGHGNVRFHVADAARLPARSDVPAEPSCRAPQNKGRSETGRTVLRDGLRGCRGQFLPPHHDIDGPLPCRAAAAGSVPTLRPAQPRQAGRGQRLRFGTSRSPRDGRAHPMQTKRTIPRNRPAHRRGG